MPTLRTRNAPTAGVRRDTNARHAAPTVACAPTPAVRRGATKVRRGKRVLVSLASLSAPFRVAVPACPTGWTGALTGRTARTFETYLVSGEGARCMPRGPLGNEAGLARAIPGGAPSARCDDPVVLVDDDERDVRETMNEDVPAPTLTADTSTAHLGKASTSGFRRLHEPLVPEEPFDAIGEPAGRGDS